MPPARSRSIETRRTAVAWNCDGRSNRTWQLRTRKRDNPTRKHIAALAKFFGVSPLYFFDVEDEDEAAVPAEVMSALADDAVRDMALRAVGLSKQSLGAIQSMIDNARRIEGLKTISGER